MCTFSSVAEPNLDLSIRKTCCLDKDLEWITGPSISLALIKGVTHYKLLHVVQSRLRLRNSTF